MFNLQGTPGASRGLSPSCRSLGKKLLLPENLRKRRVWSQCVDWGVMYSAKALETKTPSPQSLRIRNPASSPSRALVVHIFV